MDSNRTSQSDVTFWTPMRVVSTIVVFAVCAVVGVSLFRSDISSNNNSPNINSETTTNKTTNKPLATKPDDLPPMPQEALDATINNIKGKSFKLSDYKGKVILLNLWATWCGPCRMEMPELVKISEEFKGQDFEVIGLNISPDRDSPERIKLFIKQFEIPYTIGMADEDLAFLLMSESSSIPQSFLITRDGKIYRRFIGYNMRKTPRQLREAIQEAINLKG